MQLVGYHGTDEIKANNIKSEGFIYSSDGWLGAGVYFFEGDLPGFDGSKEAVWWVTHYKHFKYWVIFKADIKSTKVLDLFCSKRDQTYFDKIKTSLLNKHCQAGKKEEDFKIEEVILWIAKKSRSSDLEVIRCIVDRKRYEKGEMSYLVQRPQLQLSVLHNKESCIQNYKVFLRGELE